MTLFQREDRSPPLSYKCQVAAALRAAPESVGLSRGFPSIGSLHSSWERLDLGFLCILGEWRSIQGDRASPGEPLVQTEKEQGEESTPWKGAGLVPSDLTALLSIGEAVSDPWFPAQGPVYG